MESAVALACVVVVAVQLVSLVVCFRYEIKRAATRVKSSVIGFMRESKSSEVVLHIRENESGESRCLGRVPYHSDRASHLGGVRAFLERFEENPIVPWPFEFWDVRVNGRIAVGLEPFNDLAMHGHLVTVIRSHVVAAKESAVSTEPSTTAQEARPQPRSEDCSRATGDQNAARGPSSSGLPSSGSAGRAPSPTTERDVQELARRRPYQGPKHTVFLSHSGAQKPFVEQLCKDLEAYNHIPFFDQRDYSLGKGQKFAPLIFDAAKQCKVAVVLLSREYLGSKWPMLELVEFVRAKAAENKSMVLLPLFYKASVGDLSEEAIEKEWRPQWMKLVRHSSGRSRDDMVEEWAAAVRLLRGVNGLNFELFGKSEVRYRDEIVNQISMVAPSDLIYDMFEIVGCDRICKELAGKFLPHSGTSAQVLGLYGMGGFGKTTMSMSLCNRFSNEFLRVCYIDIKDEMKALERQQLVMRKLLNLDNRLVQDVRHLAQGWGLLQKRMKEQPVFLVLDNVQPNEVSREEALKYLNIVYNSGSKIMVISRSRDVVEDLLGEPRYCCKMPCLTTEEAAEVFLQRGAPQIQDYSSLTSDQRSVVESCLKEACFSYQAVHGEKPALYHSKVGRQYHPLALKALGVFIHGRSKTTLDIGSWKSYLPGYGKLKSTRESYTRMFEILGLQFSSLGQMTKLMFLDISLYASKALETPMLSNSPLEDLIDWLANVYEEPMEVVRAKVFDLKRFAIINIEREEIIIHDLYREYAIWYLEQATDEERLGVWTVGCTLQLDLDSSLPRELRATPSGGRCWRYLKRIRLQNVSCDNIPEWKVQEWCNIQVLQLVGCSGLTIMNLEALSCLRHLELKDLWNLKTVTFTGHEPSSRPRRYSLPPLQYVIFDGLSSLECLPSFSLFTSLKCLKIGFCEGLTEPPSVQDCERLKRMLLVWYPKQKKLPRLDGLTSLRYLTIICCDILSYQGRALKLEDLSSSSSLAALGLRNIAVKDQTDLENVTCVEYVVLGDNMDYWESLKPLYELRDQQARSSGLQAFNVWRYYRPDNRQEGLEQFCSLMDLGESSGEQLSTKLRAVSHTPRMTLIPNAVGKNQRQTLPDLVWHLAVDSIPVRNYLDMEYENDIPIDMIEAKLSLKKNIKLVFHHLKANLKRDNMMVCADQNNIIVTGLIPQHHYNEGDILETVRRFDSGAEIISCRTRLVRTDYMI